jgi:predicted RNase H-like HicB family nuclease
MRLPPYYSGFWLLASDSWILLFCILRPALLRAMINVWRLEMIFNVTIDQDEDGVWIVECPAIPGWVSQGATKEEALENVKEAIALCLEVRAEQGLPLTIETRQIEVAA